MHALLLAASQSPGARLVWIFVMLVSASKCFRMAVRPRTHAACCVALGLVPCAWLLFSMFGLINSLLADGSKAKFAVMVAFMTLGGLTLLAAVVLAVIGLIHYSAHEEDYGQGRAQAVWAIVLAFVVASLVGVGVVLGVRDSAPKPVADAGETVNFTAANFRYKPPSRPWVAIDAKKLNPLAKVALVRSNPQMAFCVLGEEVGYVLDDPEAVRELALAELRAKGSEVELVSVEPFTQGGLTWLHYVAHATLPIGRMTYHCLVLFQNGFVYQVVSFTQQEDEALLASEISRLMRGFSLIDPARYAGSISVHGEFVSRYHGYALPALELPWQRWTEDELVQDFPEAEVAVSYGEQGYLGVVPLHLAGQRLPFAALVRVLLSAMHIDPGDEALVLVDERDAGADGHFRRTYAYRSEQNGSIQAYRLQVVRSPERALLVAAWWLEGDQDTEERFAKLIDQLELRQMQPCDPNVDLEGRDESWHATAYRRLGDWFSERKEYADAVEWYRRSYACLPSALALTRWLDALREAEGAEAALKVVAERQADYPDDTAVQAWWAYLNAQAGDRELAVEVYARAFAAGLDNKWDAIDYAHLLRDLDRLDEALRFLEGFQDGTPDPEVTAAHAKLLAATDLDQALALVETRDPQGARFADLRLELYHEAGLYTKAVELGRARVEQGQANGMTHYRLGRSLLKLRWLQQAREEFELALRLGTDNDATVRKFLDHVESMLGQGNRDAIRDPIDPVAFPPALLAATSGSGGDGRTEGARYLLRTRAVRFVAGEELRETIHLRLEILDEAAAATFSTMTFDIDPALERMCVNQLLIRDAQGQVVVEGDPGEHYLTAGDDADSDMVLNITVPGLLPGRVVDLVVTRERRDPPERLEQLRHCFSLSQPAAIHGFYVEADPEQLAWEGNPLAPPVHALPNGLAWVASAPPRYVWERLQPNYWYYLPAVYVVGKSTWADVGTRYLERLAERLATPEEVAAIASEIVTEDMEATARVDALADHVRGMLTYKAIEFGVRGLVPPESTKTLERLYGDCKDHALLLYQLLHAAGVPAHLALVNARGTPVLPELPSLDPFDHMVVYVPGVRGGQLVDTTDKELGTAASPVPFGLGGARALVLDPEGPKLIETSPYSESRLRLRRRIQLDQHDLVVEERLELRGYYAGWLRGSLRGVAPEEARRVVEELLNDPSLQIEALELEHVEAIAEPLGVDLRYRVRDAVHEIDGVRVGTLPAAFERSYLVPRDETRQGPFEYDYPLALEGEVELVGASLVDPEPLDAQGLLVCRAQAQAIEGGVRLTYAATRPSGRWDASRWQGLREEAEALLGALRCRFRAGGD